MTAKRNAHGANHPRHKQRDLPRGDVNRMLKPFHVVVVTGKKRGKWGSFASAETAASVVKRLRQIGLPAEVEEPET